MRKSVNMRFMVFLAFSLCLGIVSSFLFFTGNKVLFYILSSCFFAALCGFSFVDFKWGKSKRRIIFSLVFLLIFATGALSFGSVFNRFIQTDYNGHTVTIVGNVKERAKTENGQRLILTDITLGGGNKVDFNISLYEYGGAEKEIGDRIRATVKLIPSGIYYEGKFNSYALTENIKYSATASGDAVEYLGSSPGVFESCNLFIKHSLERGMPEKEFGIAYALLCGVQEYMDGEVLQDFRDAGVAHIFAVSGLHIGFLSVVLSFALSKLKCNKYLSLIIVFAVLIFYSGVCGFSASSVRAAVMCAVLLFSHALGKKYDGLSSLSFAAVVILLVSPTQLLSAGFLLSFGVVSGILLLSGPLAKLLKFLPQKVATAVGTVVSAQLFSIPVALYFFGEFSIIAVIVNLLFIPVVGAIFVLLSVAAILGGAFGISAITLFIPSYILTAVRWVIGAFDLSVFVVGGFTLGAFSFVYYAVWITYAGMINLGVILKRVCVLSLVGVFTVGVLCINLIGLNGGKTTAIGSNGFCGACINYNGENLLVVSKATDAFPVSRLSRAAGGGDYAVCILRNSVPDVQRAVTRLNAVIRISVVRYYADDYENITVLNKSFPKITFAQFTHGDSFRFGDNTATVSAKGYALELYGEKVDCVIFAEISGDSVDYGYTAKRNYRDIWAVDSPDKLVSAFTFDNLYTFRRSATYIDAETQGNRTIKWE